MTNHVRILNNDDLETSLIDNVPFAIAHLIQFERPDGSFVYLTDAPYDITDDEDSRLYHSNKIVKVGDIQEAVEARASSMNLTLKATGLNSFVDFATFTSADTTKLFFTDSLGNSSIYSRGWDEEGFQAGDKVYIYQVDSTGQAVTYADWSSSNAYNSDNIVNYNGTDYICDFSVNVGSPNPAVDTSNWTILYKNFNVSDIKKNSLNTDFYSKTL